MIPKYKNMIYDLYEYIRNRTVAGFSAESITDEVMKRYKPAIRFYKCDYDMVYEFILSLAEFARFMYTNQLQGD